MTSSPRFSVLRRLAARLLVTSVFLALAPPALAQADRAAGFDSSDGAAYLGQQMARARDELAAGRHREAVAALDRVLSLAASVNNPRAAPAALANTLSDAVGLLLELGDVERAFGLERSAGASVDAILPATSADGVLWRLREAQLLQQVGDAPGALRALDAALSANPGAEIAGPALTLKAALLAIRGDAAGAQTVLTGHPLAASFTAPRAPMSGEDVGYLTVRVLAADGTGGADPVALASLRRPLSGATDKATAQRVAVYAAAAEVIAAPQGGARADAARRLGAAIVAAARGADSAGWRRPGLVEARLIGIALDDWPPGSDPATAFDLFQLAGRSGPHFDADALAVLSQAKDETQRRTAHQALRLTARRDRLVREQVQKILAGAAAGPATGGRLTHDVAGRLTLRDFDRRIDAAQANLALQGLSLSPDALVPLARLQAVLAPNEAVLATAVTPRGRAFLCARRDRTSQAARPTDAARQRIDARLLQAALTAGHAPSEELDAQFPAEAAVRLYDGLVRPFEPCLASGDRLIWMSEIGAAAVPLAALLPALPPKRGSGFDLAAADWLIKRHAVSYAGSAAALTAARSSAAAQAEAAEFDFLGVGDPRLDGRAPDGQMRQAIVSRGVSGAGLAALPPLPETRQELEASARGYAKARLLLGEFATERRLRQEMVGDYRNLSFATHGLLRDDLQGLSEPALVLTPVAAGETVDDGLLTASEIADLTLRARFVALSACNTANFDLSRMAQDLPALASAFAVAGAPSTLGTLWPVNSETGKRVVAGLFERLKATGASPAEVLAQAQRDFLTAPPSAAYLHPRFWAPFVILGDGGPAPAGAAPTIAVSEVQALSRSGGEVLALDRREGEWSALSISEPDAQGRRGAALRAGPRLDTPRVEVRREMGAARWLVRRGGELSVGGYALGTTGRFAPVVETLDAATGAVRARWVGEKLSAVDAFLMAGAAMADGQLLAAVAELNLRDAPQSGGGRLHVVSLGEGLAPRPLFQVSAPAGAVITDATVSPGEAGAVLVTVSYQAARPPRVDPVLDDYDVPACRPDVATVVELRSLSDGALRRRTVLPGLTAVTAVSSGGGVALGGSRREACVADGRAVVVSIDGRLTARELWTDGSLGESQVRTLAQLPGGRLLAAASKQNVVDIPPPAEPGRTPDPYALRPFAHSHSAMVVTIGPSGVSRPKLVDAGSDVYATTLAPLSASQGLLGGAIGGQASVMTLTVGAR